MACTANSIDIVLDLSAECIKRMASIIITNQQNIIINSTNALNIYVDNLKANPNKEIHTLGFKLLNEFDELFMGKSHSVVAIIGIGEDEDFEQIFRISL